MNLLRNIKISQLTNQDLSKKDKEVIDFIKDWLKDLTSLKLTPPDITTYYLNYNGKFIFYKTNDYKIIIRNPDFCDVLRQKYKLTDIMIIEILKFFLSKEFQNYTIEFFNRSMLTDIVELRHRNNSKRAVFKDFFLKIKDFFLN